MAPVHQVTPLERAQPGTRRHQRGVAPSGGSHGKWGSAGRGVELSGASGEKRSYIKILKGLLGNGGRD